MTQTSTVTVPIERSKTLSKKVLSHRSALILVSALATGKAALLLLVYLLPPGSVSKLPTSHPASSGLASLIGVFANLWDAANYVKIAHFGYPPFDILVPSKLYAFSPVYPALIFLGHYLTGSFLVSAFLVTNLLSFVFPLLILRLINFRTALLVELFPTYLVYTTVGYSDALALVFLGVAFLCFFKRRYLLTGLAVSAAGLVLYDLFLAAVPFLIYMSLFDKNRRLRAYAGVLVPVVLAGISVLVAYQITTGSPLTFFQLERILWGVKLRNPVAQVRWMLTRNESGSIANKFYVLLGLDLTSTYWVVRNLLFEAFLIGGIFLLTRIEDPRKWLYVIYSATLAIPLFFVVGTPVYSIPRLMLSAFPIFIGYSVLLRKKWQLTAYAVVAVLASFWVVLSFVYAFFA
jgi:hypothetical protein